MKAIVTNKGDIVLEAENEADNFVLRQFQHPNRVGVANEGIEINYSFPDHKKYTILLVSISPEKQKKND